MRDGGLNTDEIPAAVFTLADGTTVVTGKGGPNLPGGFIPGVTVGYGPDGTLLWQAFARMATVWGNALPNGNVCATGGYDALITCWRPVATGNQSSDGGNVGHSDVWSRTIDCDVRWLCLERR